MLPTMREKLFALIFLFVVAGPAQHNSLVVKDGFLTAQDYLNLPTAQQLGYATGVIDGMLIAPLFGAPDNGAQLQLLGRCVTGMRDTQVHAILDKFLKDHPERWNDPMHAVAFAAMNEACSKK